MVAGASHRPAAVVSQAIASCRAPLLAVAIFSALVNGLALAGPLYMLQVYDRVLTSRSFETLVVLSLLLIAAHALQGYLDGTRVKMLARIGALFDDKVSGAAFAATLTLPRSDMTQASAAQPIRDLDQVRNFLASLGPTAFFDLPWMLLFFAGCFLLHPWLGWLALAGGAIIMLVALETERRARWTVRAQQASGLARQGLVETSWRQAETIAVMGMAPALERRWREAARRHAADWLAGADATGGVGAFAKVFRVILQSAVLGLGAALVLIDELSGGAMIAASIMTARALAPIEVAVAHWKSFVAARDGLRRLWRELDRPVAAIVKRTVLPAPCRRLEARGLVVSAPGRDEPILRGVDLKLLTGEGLGIIGPSASGKSTLARTLVGAWAPLRGEVRLDGAELAQWDQAMLGRHIGYLPQDVALLDGTVAQNIARFAQDADDASIVAAARAAGAHELIIALDHGYETCIGENGAALSGGQRQRIALARALFGNPFLVVLDEPNANLDQEGDEALMQAVATARARGSIVIIVTHRAAGLKAVDQVALMGGGRIQAIGPKEALLDKAVTQSKTDGRSRRAMMG